LIEAPSGGNNILTGIGLDTGGANSRAVAAIWKSGAASLVNDVRFVGGHGTYKADGTWIEPYNNNRTGDPDPKRRWDSQYPSLWVTDGGGGTFKDIWTPSTYAQAGLYVSNTTTEGRVYAMSSEHHVRNEVKLKNVSHWKIYDLQCEEERGEGPSVLPLSLDGCSDITLANIYLYRVYNTYSPIHTPSRSTTRTTSRSTTCTFTARASFRSTTPSTMQLTISRYVTAKSPFYMSPAMRRRPARFQHR